VLTLQHLIVFQRQVHSTCLTMFGPFCLWYPDGKTSIPWHYEI